ncbi:LPS translocon maturation chaperone LptM [Vitreoscilla filiformis]|uniref:LPS translocon maturation chaperone LptM n=1 Tax=Vitreoscilla filiformis TaxID=63 RepID=UPI0012FD163F
MKTSPNQPQTWASVEAHPFLTGLAWLSGGVLLCLALAGCGQRGPLVLPTPSGTQASPSTASPPPSAPRP